MLKSWHLMIDLVFQNNTQEKAPAEEFFMEILEKGIEELKLEDKKVEVSLNLVDEAGIKELNNKYRGKNVVTDVLSFPLGESGQSKYDILPLGDIFICLPFAVQEAKRQEVSLEKELAQLTVHAFLHLLDYDHERSEEDAEKMTNLEVKILSKLNI